LKIFAKVFFILLLILFISQCGEKKEKRDDGDTNTPPVINKLILQPLNPTIQSEITARILSFDKDGDPITYKVKWFLNGNEIGEGMSFTSEEIARGDRVFAEVTPYDGKDWGNPMRSSDIIIGGLPPKILSLQIAPESLFVTTPQVVVTAMVEDPDKDSITLIIHWMIKDEIIPDTSNVLNLKKFSLKKNDVITCSAFADDGEFRSEPFIFKLLIANAPPVFKTEIDSIKCTPDSIYYRLPIIDPDGDPLNFELLDAPDGIQIDQERGIIYGSAGQVTTFEIMVRATDTDGAYSETKFTLTSP